MATADPNELEPDLLLYRIILREHCSTGVLEDIQISAFYDYGSRVLCYYYSGLATTEEAVKAFCEESGRSPSEVTGVVAITVSECRKAGASPVLDGDPVPSHVTAYIKKGSDRKKMRLYLRRRSINRGWQ